jgi:hypothetical protein
MLIDGLMKFTFVLTYSAFLPAARSSCSVRFLSRVNEFRVT